LGIEYSVRAALARRASRRWRGAGPICWGRAPPHR